jgi:hypothetical protein
MARASWFRSTLALCLWACGGATPDAQAPSAATPGDPFPADACPANVFPPVEREVRYLSERCAPKLQVCTRLCDQGDGNACYAAALRLQELGAADADSEPLFLRACRLGVASGCTNRAAGIMKLEAKRPGALECATQTFDAMCTRADPWACTMLAFNLARGLGAKRDLARALEVLPAGCRLGPDDVACQRALELKKAIEAARGQ